MDTSLSRVLLEFSAAKLRQLTGRITDCLGRLNEEQVWARSGDNSNAVANLVLHLAGNVRQWIISGVGGVPDVRRRAAEFATRGGLTRVELAARLHSTVEEAVPVIERLTSERLAERLTIQGYEVTVLETVLHVVEHFAQHAGQIIYATKLATGADLGYYRHLSQDAPRTDPSP